MRSLAAFVTLAGLASTACDRTPEVRADTFSPSSAPVTAPPPSSPTPTTAAAAPGASAAPSVAAYRLPASSRVVAIGDLHGDLRALRATLRLAGAIDSDDRWIGKDLTVVQTGDQIDRGDQDREVLDVMSKLQADAKAAGGALHVLNGNHELMNATFDFRYVSRRGFAGFDDFGRRAQGAAERLPDDERGRAAAFTPGAEYARALGQHLTVALVGDNLFAHAGVLPAHVDYGLDRINREASEFLLGKLRALPPALASEESPVWTRFYGGEVEDATCQTALRVLSELGAKRLIVGHTVQKSGINGACQDRLFRIDVGLSSYYGDNPPQVLELTAKGARILTAPGFESSQKSQAPGSALHSRP